MAWSDAARAAALETRRLHARVKGTFYSGKYREPADSFLARKDTRKMIAGELRAWRAGDGRGGMSGQTRARSLRVMQAVHSTYSRNTLRKK